MNYRNFKVNYQKINFPLKESFKISRGTKKLAKTIKIELKENNQSGFGECVPYKRYNESERKIINFLKKKKRINNLKQIPYPSLRNALSNAEYDLKLKNNKIKFKNIIKKTTFDTIITVPITTKKNFIKKIKQLKFQKIIKIKLDEKNVFIFLNLLKKYLPKSQIIIDANEGWSLKFLKKNEKKLKKYKILFIEQPVRSINDQKLKKINLPLCADESFHLNNHYKKINKIYKWVNIKPDKFGEDKEILNAIKFAKKNRLKIMMGCMVSSSLSIVPSLRFAKHCNLLDLDGAMFLRKDIKNGIKYSKGKLIYNSKFKFGH